MMYARWWMSEGYPLTWFETVNRNRFKSYRVRID